MSWKVKFFQTVRGDAPVKEFIELLERSGYLKAFRTIRLLEKFGPFIKPPYAKKIQGTLYELRVVGKDSIRIFYTQQKDAYYILHAFKKKTQKTPQKEIQIALDRMKEII